MENSGNIEKSTEKVVDMLTSTSVSINTKEFIEIEGKKLQIEDFRCAYVNSERDRAKLVKDEPEEVVTSVLAMWGETPTIVEEYLSVQ